MSNTRYTFMRGTLLKPAGNAKPCAVVTCLDCGSLVENDAKMTEAHDKFHDNHIQRRASYVTVNADQSASIQFIDGTQVTLDAISFDEAMDFVRHQNDLIEPGWIDAHPMMDEG